MGSKYQEWLSDEGLLKLETFAKSGLTDSEIAKRMKVSVSTLNNYKKQYKKIDEALKNGREYVDTKIENALIKRAIGYEYTEQVMERVLNKETGEYEFVLTKEMKKEVKPDISAQVFWLKNRRPDIWKDKQELNVESSSAEFSNLTDEELEQRIVMLKQKLKVGGEDE